MLQIFQYNSCYCLSLLKRWISPISANFNTTLVIVYLHNATDKIIFEQFQYNSCYCLSMTPETFRMNRHLYFNTTLVIVYREVYTGISITGIISIQLLLLFIHKCGHQLLRLWEFQYNSCYCLSVMPEDVYEQVKKFQYNSCYCLSEWGRCSWYRIGKFQYNSCYCLSGVNFSFAFTFADFNTTLVIVYRCFHSDQFFYLVISIQLLLLFIWQMKEKSIQ